MGKILIINFVMLVALVTGIMIPIDSELWQLALKGALIGLFVSLIPTQVKFYGELE